MDLFGDFNVEELYVLLLRQISRRIGGELSARVSSDSLLCYVQYALRIDNATHEKLQRCAETGRRAPAMLLSVEILEASNLKPKNLDGSSSNPFVCVYLASDPGKIYETQVKIAEVCPIWRERFQIPLKTGCDDTLHLEVWHFEPDESLPKKCAQLLEKSAAKNLRTFLKRIATKGAASSRLIGKASLQISGIPASGLTMRYNLYKESKTGAQGTVKVTVSFCAPADRSESSSSITDYKRLLHLFLTHELEVGKNRSNFRGFLSPDAETLLLQHSVQSGLKKRETLLSKLVIYVDFLHELSYEIIADVFSEFVDALNSENVVSSCPDSYWKCVRKLLPSCFRSLMAAVKDVVYSQQLEQVLRIFSALLDVKIKQEEEEENLFSSREDYEWYFAHFDANSTEGDHQCVRTFIKAAIAHCASGWFEEHRQSLQDCEEADRLEVTIQLVLIAKNYLLESTKAFEQHFKKTVQVDFGRTVYELLQVKIAEITEPVVVTSTKLLGSKIEAQTAITQTDFYRLYVALQKFLTVARFLCPGDYAQFQSRKFHRWFLPAVKHWLETLVLHTRNRVEKSVNFDDFEPIEPLVRHSSSAVDVLSAFHQIRHFWDELIWPDPQSGAEIVTKIANDISDLCAFYAHKVALKLRTKSVGKEWCCAINNLQFLRQSLPKIDFQFKCSDLNNAFLRKTCETTTNKLRELTSVVLRKMTPEMRLLLAQCATSFQRDPSCIHSLISYIDRNLSVLYRNLPEELFENLLETVWSNLLELLQAHGYLAPAFYGQLHEAFLNMVESVRSSSLSRIEEELKLNRLSTNELIHQVHLQQWKAQKKINSSPYGQLSISAKFDENSLEIRIFNARNLAPLDNNSAARCDSYVQIRLFPEEAFDNVRLRTKTRTDTPFPLFDESFNILLTRNQRYERNGLVMFSVHNARNSHEYLGDAFLHFYEITDTPVDLGALKQIQLQLGRVTNTSSPAISCLKRRTGDKKAADFIQKLAANRGDSHPGSQQRKVSFCQSALAYCSRKLRGFVSLFLRFVCAVCARAKCAFCVTQPATS